MPLAGAITLLAITGHTQAVPYASGVQQVGNTVSFTLNEPADTVTITRNYNDTFLVLNNVTAGEHSFDLAGSADYTISVTHSAPAVWLESSISVNNPMFSFERLNGIAVNQNPASPYFGRFYFAHRDDTTTAFGGFPPRNLGDGIYVFNSDGTDAFGITDLNDTTAARTAGLDFSASPASPWRLSIGPDDTLYVSDASDPTGGIYYTDPDVSTGGNLLAGLGGTQPIAGQNHGSIISKPLVSGSMSTGDLVLYTIDQDLPGSVTGTGSHVWRYDVGSTDNYAGAPTLVLDASTLGINSDGSDILVDTNIGNFDANSDSATITDLVRDPITGNFIIFQHGTGLIITDPSLSTILFNSQQFFIDNPQEYDALQYIVSAAVSPDGKTLALRTGGNGNRIGSPLLVELDQAGMPVLDPSAGNGLGIKQFVGEPIYPPAPRSPIAYDLAGNIYNAGNFFERSGIYSPGGDTTAVTRSNGTFTINGTTYGDHLIGDLSGDGFVGIDDLSIVLGNWNDAVAHGVFTLGDPTGDGFVGIDDLNVVLSHWNEGTPPTNGSQTHIPEPTSLWLLGAGAWACGVRTGRRKKQI